MNWALFYFIEVDSVDNEFDPYPVKIWIIFSLSM